MKFYGHILHQFAKVVRPGIEPGTQGFVVILGLEPKL